MTDIEETPSAPPRTGILPRSHKKIISDYGAAKIADKLGISRNTVNQWAKRDAISSPYWWWLARAKVCTLAELAETEAWRTFQRGELADQPEG